MHEVGRVREITFRHAGGGTGKAIDIILNVGKESKKVIVIGNGGSAAIASHIAADFTKNGDMKANAFNNAFLIKGGLWKTLT